MTINMGLAGKGIYFKLSEDQELLPVQGIIFQRLATTKDGGQIMRYVRMMLPNEEQELKHAIDEFGLKDFRDIFNKARKGERL